MSDLAAQSLASETTNIPSRNQSKSLLIGCIIKDFEHTLSGTFAVTEEAWTTACAHASVKQQ